MAFWWCKLLDLPWWNSRTLLSNCSNKPSAWSAMWVMWIYALSLYAWFYHLPPPLPPPWPPPLPPPWPPSLPSPLSPTPPSHRHARVMMHMHFAGKLWLDGIPSHQRQDVCTCFNKPAEGRLSAIILLPKCYRHDISFGDKSVLLSFTLFCN